jgi:hypothetical protein
VRCTVKKTVGKKAKSVKFGEVKAAGILRVCKSIHNEARSLLYAENKFAFKSFATLDTFFDVAKPAFRLLENVEFIAPFSLYPPKTAPFIHAPKLSRMSFRITHSKISVLEILLAIDNMLYGDTNDCRGRTANPDPRHNKQQCPCNVPALRNKRLESMPIYTPNMEIHLKDAITAGPFHIRADADDLKAIVLQHAKVVLSGDRITMFDDDAYDEGVGGWVST